MRQFWTPAGIARLEELVEQGLTASQIAKEMEITRNAVIGKVHRLGLKLKTPACGGGNKSVKRLEAEAKIAKRERRVLRKKFPEQQMVPSTEVVAAPEPLIPPLGISLMDLEAGDCRWPLGNQREPATLFCGLPAVANCSYCLQHKRLAYQPIQRGKKEPSALGEVSAFNMAWK